MDFWNSAAGMVEAELTSASPEDALAAFSIGNLEIWNVQKQSDLTYTFFLSRRNYKEAERISRKRGDVLKVRRRFGPYWFVKQIRSRPLLLFGTLFLLILVFWLPTRVFFVEVEGNIKIPERKILAAAEDCGISFGASRREVRSERVKNALLSAVPELQWAGVNTFGCTAKISVREKADSKDQEAEHTVASIVASRDGYILSGVSTAGNLLVKSGQSVQEGQVLISAYTDCGLCIRAERAEGEIMAQTNRCLDAVMPSQSLKKGETEEVKRKVSLLVRKKRIFLWKDSGIWEGSCGRMYEEYYITLPGGFRLPVAVCVESYILCQTETLEIPEKNAREELRQFAKDYLLQQMSAGKIIGGVPYMTAEDGLYRLRGEFACTEMIGKVRQEQIGDTNGENS